MRICEHCLQALQSRGEVRRYTTIDIELELELEEDKTIICEWCEEPIEDGYIYEI